MSGLYTIPIYDASRPTPRRIFDVKADAEGNIRRYELKNVRELRTVSDEDVRRQIQEYLKRLTEEYRISRRHLG